MTSPRPTAYRAFTVLLAVLLVASVVAPIAAAEPAAAQEDTTSDFDCSLSYAVVFPGACVPTSDGSVSGTTEVDLHTISVSEWESYESHHVNFGNYVDDMETVAYIDARNAIADEWENGSTETEAYQAARAEIRDYYAAQQRNHLMVMQKVMAQHYSTKNVSVQESDIDDGFLSSVSHNYVMASNTVDFLNTNSAEMTLVNGQENVSTELVNSSSVDWTTMQLNFTVKTYDQSAEKHGTTTEIVPFDPVDTLDYNSSADVFAYRVNAEHSQVVDVQTYGTINTMNVGEQLHSERVWDAREWYDLWSKLEQQSSEATSAFSQEQVSGIYTGLETGQLNVSDLRTAEGQVRHMSGDAEAQSGAYQLALYENLDLQGPDLSNVSTMRVSYEGATGMELLEEGNERVRNYTNPVDQTYEGILYATEAPADGFKTNESYNTANLSGSVKMVPFDGEAVRFYDGTFTIEAMYDSDGNEVKTANWDSPEPESYSSDDFVEYIDTTTETRKQIQDDEGGGGDGISISNPFEDIGAGGTMVGLVVIVAAVGVVVAVVFRRP